MALNTYTLQYKGREGKFWYTVEWGLTLAQAIRMKRECDQSYTYRIQPEGM